jgi:hypothetical protein
VALLDDGLHVLVKLVQERDASGNVDASNDLVRDVVKVPGE